MKKLIFNKLIIVFWIFFLLTAYAPRVTITPNILPNAIIGNPYYERIDISRGSGPISAGSFYYHIYPENSGLEAGILKLPALIYKTKRQMNDYKAADMLEILKIFGKGYYDFVDVAAFDATKAPQLFNTFRDQSKIFAWGEYAPLMIRMINQLQKNIGGIYTDSLMDKAMSDYSTMENSVKQIGEFIGSRLKSNNGRLYEDDLKIIEDNIRNTKLPRFDTWRDNTNGLGITIHDTWSTHITLESISITGRQYTAKISYKIQDHFGLDNTDIKDGGALGIKFKTLRMFRIWFILQRWKGHGFKPFINEMNVVKIVTGTF